MRTLSSLDCLSLWESGGSLHPLDQGLMVLGAALPETPHEALADWPLGRRNSALAKLRCDSFGPRFQGLALCRRCGEKLEVEIDSRIFTDETMDQGRVSEKPVVVNGCSFRLLTTRDLAKAAQETDVSRAAVCLAESCRLESGEAPIWSDDELEKIGQELALADPLAELQMALRCPACENKWEEAVDLVSFVWREIEARSRRLLLEIHTLASAYGWTEAEILALSERRRSLYLEMVQS